MAGNGDGRRGIYPCVGEPLWDQVKSFVWEARRCRTICFDERTAFAVRVENGLVYCTGPSEGKLQVAVDCGRLIGKVMDTMSEARQERFWAWIDGVPAASLRDTERAMLKADVRKIEEAALQGGYERFLLQRRDVSATGE